MKPESVTARRTASEATVPRGAVGLVLCAVLTAAPLAGVAQGAAAPAPRTEAGTSAAGRGLAPLSGALSPAASPAQERGVRAAAEQAAATGTDWEPCAQELQLPTDVRCAVVAVPVDYAVPDGPEIQLHLSRSPATGPPAERQGPLLYNPGGPGGNGMTFPLYPDRLADEVWRDLHHAYDLVGFAPRGVGQSAPLSCQDPQEFQRGAGPAPQDPSEAFKQRMNDEAAAYAEGCAASYGEQWLAQLTTANNARDLHVVNAALGAEGLTYLGVSWGSYLGSVYASLFPESVRRMVLDSVVNPDPELLWYRSNLRQSLAFEDRWQAWKEWVASHQDSYGLGAGADEVQRHYEDARAAAEAELLAGDVGARELHDAFLAVAYTDAAWPGLAEALADFHAGNPQPLRDAARPDRAETEAARRENARAVYNAVECADAPWPTNWDRWDRDHTRVARVAPFATWQNAWGNLPCAHWQVPGGDPVDVGAAPGALPPVLLVHASEDAATPYAGALETQRRLPGASLVTEDGAGQHGVTGGNDCVDDRVRDYLLTGEAPDGDTSCPARPAPVPERAAGARPAG